MTTKILALTDALGNLARFVLLPGHRFDTVGVAPLIKDLAFGGLIADKAFDSNAILADLDKCGAKVVISQHSRRASPRPDRCRTLQVAALDREFLLQAQGVQTHRHAQRQDRSELLRHDPSCRLGHSFEMNLNRP